MIKHIVLWKMKKNNKQENLQKMKTILEALPQQIAQINYLEVGIDFSHSDASADIILISAFNSEEELNIYRKHPDHQKAVTFINQVVQDRTVIDYEI